MIRLPGRSELMRSNKEKSKVHLEPIAAEFDGPAQPKKKSVSPNKRGIFEKKSKNDLLLTIHPN